MALLYIMAVHQQFEPPIELEISPLALQRMATAGRWALGAAWVLIGIGVVCVAYGAFFVYLMQGWQPSLVRGLWAIGLVAFFIIGPLAYLLFKFGKLAIDVQFVHQDAGMLNACLKALKHVVFALGMLCMAVLVIYLVFIIQ